MGHVTSRHFFQPPQLLLHGVVPLLEGTGGRWRGHGVGERERRRHVGAAEGGGRAGGAAAPVAGEGRGGGAPAMRHARGGRGAEEIGEGGRPRGGGRALVKETGEAGEEEGEGKREKKEKRKKMRW